MASASESKTESGSSPRKTAPLPAPPESNLKEVALNVDYGGFCLSDRALDFMHRMSGVHYPKRDIPRDDPYLIMAIKELGEAANGESARLCIVTIPQDADDAEAWELDDYDGVERVVINHEKIKLYKAAQEEKEKTEKRKDLARYIGKKLREDDLLSDEDEDDYDDDDEDYRALYGKKPKWECDIDRFADIVSKSD